MNKLRFPSVRAVASALVAINRGVDSDCDVRLQVYPDGAWAVRFGLSDYDLDHRGYWGSSGVPGGRRRFRSRDVARDLLDQAKDHYAEEQDQ